ncbi:uroporphyrinogen-III synthase [Acinetobacter sp. YH16032]|uniref:uroporphyrinogen-III synthase n=1 Tax=Acinetobacter sp. YH16032 TaxID=2601181 RepID=UPI0015D1E0B0|nr:uroporphyrinogen-III synthase [Acinetobacter sp. YH16032]
MKFINTRPADRAKPLNEALVRAGYEPIELSVLELAAVHWSDELDQLFQQLISAQVIVVVSPTAVEVGMLFLEKSGLKLTDLNHIKWIAVGRKTAEALSRYGVKSLVPDVETSEGMLSLSVLTQNADLKRIAFWRGEGGRQFMMQQCRTAKIEVLNFVLYSRYCPSDAQDKFKHLLEAFNANPQPYAVLISSEASWKNWLSLCKNYPVFMQHGHYLVLANRLYQIVCMYQQTSNTKFQITQIADLMPDTILSQLESEHRHS